MEIGCSETSMDLDLSCGDFNPVPIEYKVIFYMRRKNILYCKTREGHKVRVSIQDDIEMPKLSVGAVIEIRNKSNNN